MSVITVPHPKYIDLFTERGVVFGDDYLLIPPDFTHEEWAALGQFLKRIDAANPWWIGDWWTWGENRLHDTSSQEAADLYGIDPDTILSRGSVVRAFPPREQMEGIAQPFTRVKGCYFSYHRLMAPLVRSGRGSEAIGWLERARDEQWTYRKLADEYSRAKYLGAQAMAMANAAGAVAGRVYRVEAAKFLTGLEPESADLLLTDPPYATDIHDIAGFAAEWVPLALSRVRDDGRAYICTGPYPEEVHAYLDVLRAEQRLKLEQILVWTYRNTMGPAPTHVYKNNWQSIFYLRGPRAEPLNCPVLLEHFSVQDISAPGGATDRVHPWQKPDELAQRFIRHATMPGQTVIDPFAGTGAFVAAAALMGRPAMGSEIEAGALDLCRARGLEVWE